MKRPFKTGISGHKAAWMMRFWRSIYWASYSRRTAKELDISYHVPASAAVGQSVRLSAQVADSSGVEYVEWNINGQTSQNPAAPYAFDWTPKLSGTYRVKAAVVDKAGNRTDSGESVIEVRP